MLKRYITQQSLLILSSICYLIWCFDQTRVSNSFAQKASNANTNRGDIVALGEGLLYGQLLTVMVGVGGGMLLLLHSIVYKEKRSFNLTAALLFLATGIAYTVYIY